MRGGGGGLSSFGAGVYSAGAQQEGLVRQRVNYCFVSLDGALTLLKERLVFRPSPATSVEVGGAPVPRKPKRIAT